MSFDREEHENYFKIKTTKRYFLVNGPYRSLVNAFRNILFNLNYGVSGLLVLLLLPPQVNRKKTKPSKLKTLDPQNLNKILTGQSNSKTNVTQMKDQPFLRKWAILLTLTVTVTLPQL